ncbi:MAG: hypothetical protein M3389_17225 [Actinomycetota bacterium]|nr:hypothetical protein [Actinomycetota bacterium]
MHDVARRAHERRPPPRCGTSRRWTLKTIVTLDDDTTETYSHRQRCRR